MGYKLGQMVNKLLITFLCFFVIELNASLKINPMQIEKIDKLVSLDQEAIIYSVNGSHNNISLTGIRIDKPSKKSLKLLKLVSPRDKYALRVVDKNDKEIMLIGLGNPFYIHADHIGYENSDVFGGYVEQKFDFPLPLSTDASQFILLSQNKYGFKEIKRIQLN